MESYGSTIRRARIGKKLTLERVARACGTHKGYISGIENRQINPPRPKITKRICRVLSLPITQMIVLSCIEKAPEEARFVFDQWYRQEYKGLV